MSHFQLSIVVHTVNLYESNVRKVLEGKIYVKNKIGFEVVKMEIFSF